MADQRLRVLHVIYSFMIGGSEQLVLTLVRSMPELTHGVVAVDLAGPLESEFRDAGASTWRLHRIENGRRKATSELRRIVREFKPDVIHSHHLHELIYALPASIGSGARRIHTEHEYYSLLGAKPRLMLRALSLGCAAVTGADEETVRYLQRSVGIPERKVVLVPNGISAETYRRSGSHRAGLGLQESDLVVGVVARLEPVKGHEILLAAFAAVREQFPGAKLLVIGDGSRRGELEALSNDLGIAGAVDFLGARRDIPEILAALDVVALCSHEEGLPMSLLEAMAAAKPVVATAVGGIPKLLQDGKNGLLIPPGNVSAAAAAVGRLLDSRELRSTLGTAAAKTVDEQYSLARTVAVYKNLYDERHTRN